MSAETRDNKDWRALAEAARMEKDPARLLELVAKLNRVLEEQTKPQFPVCTTCATE